MAKTKTLRLEVGKKYRTRDEQVAEVHEVRASGTYCVDGTVDGAGRCWTADGVWYVGEEGDLDLVEEIPEPRNLILEPGKRYLTRDGQVAEVTGPNGHVGEFVFEGRVDGRREVWRSDGSWHWVPGVEHELDLDKDLLSDPNIIECGDGLIFGVPERPANAPDVLDVSFKTTEDLTFVQRTRIAKLAARIVLADGPVLSVDELAGMTVGELITILEDITIYSI